MGYQERAPPAKGRYCSGFVRRIMQNSSVAAPSSCNLQPTNPTACARFLWGRRMGIE